MNHYLSFIKKCRRYAALALLMVTAAGMLRAQGSVPFTLIPPPFRLENSINANSYHPLQLMAIRSMLDKGKALIWEKPDSAAFWMKKVMDKSRAIGYPDGIAEAYMNLGLAAMGQGNFDSSFNSYQQAYRYIHFSSKKEILLGALYINIGATYSYQADYEQALRYDYLVLQSLIRQNADNNNIVMAYNNLADVLLRMGQYGQADYYIEQGEHLAGKNNNVFALAYILSNKGDIATGRKKYGLADSCYQKALEYARRSANQEVEQAIYSSIGKMLLLQGKPAEAVPVLQQAAALNSRNYPYFSSIAPYYNLGEALYKTGQYKEAEAILLEALSKAARAGIRENKLNALSTLAAVYEHTGQTAKALEQRKIFISLQDSLLSREKIQAMNQMEVRYRTLEKERELVRKQLEITQQQRRISQQNLLLALIVSGSLLTLFALLMLYKNSKNKQSIAVLQAMIAGAEQERSRTAQELHDGIGGMLAAIQMQLSTLQQTQGVDEVASMMKNASAEIRRTAHNLMPDIINRHTFLEALQLYCATLNHASTGMQVLLQVHDPISIPDKATELSLYRILQELLQNVVKHARATEVIIQAHQQNNRINIMVEDNGTGFDVAMVSNGLGMHNLNLRVNMLKGQLRLESSPGNGTTATISIPV